MVWGWKQFTTPSVVNFSPYENNPCKKGSTRILFILLQYVPYSTDIPYFVIKVLNYLLHKYELYGEKGKKWRKFINEGENDDMKKDIIFTIQSYIKIYTICGLCME